MNDSTPMSGSGEAAVTTAQTPAVWRCDQCGCPVTAQDGVLIYRSDATGDDSHDFRIVHHERCFDYLKQIGRSHKPPAGWAWHPLRDFIGVVGLARLLFLLGDYRSADPRDIECRVRQASIGDWLHVVRRIALPHYEAAHRHIKQAYADGMADHPDEFTELARLAQIVELYELQDLSADVPPSAPPPACGEP